MSTIHPITDTATTATDTPSAWIGCLHCYNDGRLVGRWFDLTDPEEVEIISGDNQTADEPPTADNPTLLMAVHVPHNLTPECEELWVMDHENLPISGECDPLTLTKIAEDYDEIETTTGNHGNEWAAFCAYNLYQYGDSLEISPDSFVDEYHGEWSSFQEYAYDFAGSTGWLRDIPEGIARHIDWESYAEELEQDFTTIDTPSGNVWIFRS